MEEIAGPAPTYGMTMLLWGLKSCINMPPEMAPPRYNNQKTLFPWLFKILFPKEAIISELKTA